jgi:hypothetical protein
MLAAVCDFPNPGWPAIRVGFPRAMRPGHSQVIGFAWIFDIRSTITSPVRGTVPADSRLRRSISASKNATPRSA